MDGILAKGEDVFGVVAFEAIECTIFAFGGFATMDMGCNLKICDLMIALCDGIYGI